MKTIAKEIKERTKTALILIVCVILYVLLQILTITSDRAGLSAFNGVYMACQFGLCLTMMQIRGKKGITISMVLMSVSLILLLRAFLFLDNEAPVPGIFNSTIYLLTLLFLKKFFKKRESEAVTDFTTGLLNNRGILQYLKRKTESGYKLSVLYIDLENFRILNDRHGHEYGDLLMKKIAERIKDTAGRDCVVARMDGDEFVVVLNGETDAESASDEILSAIKKKIKIPVNNVKIENYVTAHAGISEFPKDTKNYEELIKFADIAMIHAAKSKSEKAYFFDKSMAEEMEKQVEIEKLIKDGLEKDYFYLVYQPQFHAEGQSLRGFETLIRMITPEGKNVSPGDFIPVAEMNDLIIKIDNYVLKRSMMEFREIVKNVNNSFILSINVSAKNIGNPSFPEKLCKIISETDFPAENLEIEITEYCFAESVDITIDNIRKLRKLGIHVALDDFGTGYTSLSYLAKMPVNLLKIDKSLIDDIEVNEKSRNFANTVISLGHMMECEVISEGVENQNQVDILKSQGCNFIQGFVWGKPLGYYDAKNLSYKHKK